MINIMSSYYDNSIFFVSQGICWKNHFFVIFSKMLCKLCYVNLVNRDRLPGIRHGEEYKISYSSHTVIQYIDLSPPLSLVKPLGRKKYRAYQSLWTFTKPAASAFPAAAAGHAKAPPRLLRPRRKEAIPRLFPSRPRPSIRRPPPPTPP